MFTENDINQTSYHRVDQGHFIRMEQRQRALCCDFLSLQYQFNSSSEQHEGLPNTRFFRHLYCQMERSFEFISLQIIFYTFSSHVEHTAVVLAFLYLLPLFCIFGTLNLSQLDRAKALKINDTSIHLFEFGIIVDFKVFCSRQRRYY